jgi:ornithine carbamoyltransferase
MSFNLRGRNFLTLKNFTTKEIEFLLDLSAELKSKKRTRARCAFTVAAIDEGAHPEYLGRNDIHFGAKEDTKDTARVLERMFDGIQFRGFKHSAVKEIAKYAGVPIWNRPHRRVRYRRRHGEIRGEPHRRREGRGWSSCAPL